jgi:cell division protein FtsL
MSERQLRSALFTTVLMLLLAFALAAVAVFVLNHATSPLIIDNTTNEASPEASSNPRS